ncbi:hypothetical protein FHS16_002060 [Paenibacillus endophyticus]|uniref:DUF4184 family protein n=2 Tax=Paenibacillus endophyticus TaxID=1294268 RepID=A0A7W5C8H3_9BACL|nr:hypothetical protein [Paenibacillus endophyticus]
MSPDIEYFIAMQPFRSIGHDMLGFFLLSLPTCIAFAFAFHLILKPSLPKLLPNIAGIDRFALHENQPWQMSSIKDGAAFAISLLIGFLSHVTLDHFTHSGGWFVVRLPFLQSVFLGDSVFHILQLSLSALGLGMPCLYLMFRFFAYKKRNKKVEAARQTISPKINWGSVFVVAVVFLSAKLLSAGSFFSISIWVVAPITSGLVGIYFMTLINQATANGHRANAIYSVCTIAGLIILFKCLASFAAVSTAVWIMYIWLLTASILVSALRCQNK